MHFNSPQINNKMAKPYDVVILGASGFTGKHVVREALKFLNAPNSPLKSLALAGRSPSRLSKALDWAAAPNSPPPQIPLLTADSSDPDSLARVASQAKIILACVGPFRLYGPPIVAACVEAGCDYLDVCGELDFMERTEAVYHDKAAENGSLVISACGFDSVPAEIGLLFHSRQWSGASVPNRVDSYLTLESDKRIALNFCTYESAVLIFAHADKLEELRRSRPRRARPAIPGPEPGKSGPRFVKQKQLGLWAMKIPSSDAAVVGRTQATWAANPKGLPGANESGEAAKKREEFWTKTKPAHFSDKFSSKSLLGLLPAIVLGVLFTVLSKFSAGRWLLLKFPEFFSMGLFRREGPSEEEVASARFTTWFVGKGYSSPSSSSAVADTEIVTRVTGPEVGYVTTPIVLVQCALIVLGDRAGLPKGGVYTPGIVFGHTDIQKRLQDNGFLGGGIRLLHLKIKNLYPGMVGKVGVHGFRLNVDEGNSAQLRDAITTASRRINGVKFPMPLGRKTR